MIFMTAPFALKITAFAQLLTRAVDLVGSYFHTRMVMACLFSSLLYSPHYSLLRYYTSSFFPRQTDHQRTKTLH